MNKVSDSKKDKSFEERYKRAINTQGSEKIWNYFLDLIKTEKFQKKVEMFRKEIKESKKPNNYDISQRIISTAISYGLDGEEWEQTFQDYIRQNKLTKPEGIDVCKITNIPDLEEIILEGKKEDESYLRPSFKHPPENFNIKMNLLMNYPIVILVNPNASLRDIIDFITKNYGLSITNLQKAYKENSGILNFGKSKRKSIRIQKRNDFIYKNRNLPRKKLMSLVGDKFGYHSVIDYGYIGKIISMEKRARKQV